METISVLLALCEGKPPVTGGFPSLTKASELWCFLWSMPEQTDEHKMETPVIWDVIALIMASPYCIPYIRSTNAAMYSIPASYFIETKT